MNAMRFGFAIFVAAATAAFSQQSQPLPELKIDAVAAGSVLRIRNIAPLPLTAYLIELVDYPGSSFANWQDAITGELIAPGVEINVPISNMTVGAVPDYVKLQAALYADGSSSGVPEKVALLIASRRAQLETARELIARLNAAIAKETPVLQLVAALSEWADAIKPPGKPANRVPLTMSNQMAMIYNIKGKLATQSVPVVLKQVQAREQQLIASKPPL